ncbi:hypothetical protein IG631_23396 [Alternaria alternata]|nr:hypothetical protein IG631_23396 [Alternaria alternata]
MKRDSVIEELEDLKRIITSLRSETDDQAAAVLGRLRFGELPGNVTKTLYMTGSSALYGQPPRGLETSKGFTVFMDSRSQATSWSSSAHVSPSSALSREKEDPSIGGASTNHAFLVLLFDRNDFLLARNEPEDNSKETDYLERVRIDTRLLRQQPDCNGGKSPLLSFESSSRIQRPSLDRQCRAQSIYPTQLTGRQSIVNTVCIHRNLNSSNLFSHMPFPSSIKDDNYSAGMQHTQINDFFLPTWAMLPINTVPVPGLLGHALPSILQEAASLSYIGLPIEQLIEIHPNIAALFDEDEFMNSGVLSKWAVRMVHSMLLKVWPAFRELVVQIPAMQERMEWFMDMSINIECDWPYATWEALGRNEETGQVDLCDAAREVVRDLGTWTVGSSFREYFGNADSYVRIREEKS